MFIGWLTFAVVVLAFAVSTGVNDARARFAQLSHGMHVSLYDRMQVNQMVLEGFAALFGAIGKSDEVTARRYAARILQRYPHIYALEIVEPVARENIQRFIQQQRQKEPGFDIKAFTYEGSRQWQALPEKSYYYPLVFIEPMRPGSETVLGLDIGSIDFLNKPMQEAMSNGLSVSSRPFRLVEGNLAYLLFQPMASRGEFLRPLADGVANRQTVELVVDADKLIPSSLQNAKDIEISVYKSDCQAPAADCLLVQQHALPADFLASWLLPEFADVQPIGVAGQDFSLAMRKQLNWHDLNPPLLISLSLASVLALLLLIGFSRVHYRGKQRDILLHEQLRYEASYDYLTGLPNRNLVIDRLQQAIARAQRQRSTFSVLFLDLNGFKVVNDRYGHEAGDILLRVVAERIKCTVREGDTVARWSGDEFLVVLENTLRPEDVTPVIQKIRHAVAAPVAIGDGQDIAVTASVGGAYFPEDSTAIDEIIKIADARMYLDKREMNGER